MKIQKVGFCYTQYGVVEVKAKNKEKAREMVKEHLEEKGLNNLRYSSTEKDIYID